MILSRSFRDFATVLLDCGCRPGELRTLEADRIDWDRSSAIVQGKTGWRPISLTARSLDVLRRWAEKYPTGPVLRNSRGTPWTAAAVQHQFRRCSIRAGHRVIPYQARHDYWSRAHKAGVSDLVIAKQLGHRDLKMLVDVYAHVDMDMTRDAVERAASSGIPSGRPLPDGHPTGA